MNLPYAWPRLCIGLGMGNASMFFVQRFSSADHLQTHQSSVDLWYSVVYPRYYQCQTTKNNWIQILVRINIKCGSLHTRNTWDYQFFTFPELVTTAIMVWSPNESRVSSPLVGIWCVLTTSKIVRNKCFTWFNWVVTRWMKLPKISPAEYKNYTINEHETTKIRFQTTQFKN